MVDRKELIDVALGKTNPNLVIKGGNLVNVNTREIYKTDIALKGNRIAYVGDAQQLNTDSSKIIDAEGKLIIPGLMDAHFHTESSMLTITELARILVPRGVISIMADPHEIANVLGSKGIELVMREAKGLPLRIFLRVPGQVPAVPGVETTGGKLSLYETKKMLRWETTVALAGDVNVSLILNKNKEHLKKIEYTTKLKKTIAGQAFGLSEAELNAFVAAGPEDSHVSTNADEALRKIRLGLKAILASRPFEIFKPEDFKNLAEMVKKYRLDTKNLLLCVDDKMANDLAKEGHIDHVVRLAIREGFDPITAVQMATINVAEHFRINRDFGSISPGKIADIVILNNLEKVLPDKVIVDGKIVAENGKLLVKLKHFKYPKWSKNTMHLKNKITTSDLEVKVKKNVTSIKTRILVAGVPKEEIIEEIPVMNHAALPILEKDILKMAVIERHKKTGNIGRGFIKGVGLKSGAFATSYSHDHHNIFVIGANSKDMAICVNKLVETGGGLIAVDNGKIIGKVELPIAGIISDKPYEIVAEKLEKFEAVIREELGCKLYPAPIFQLSVVPLPNIPFLGLTDKGLFSVRRFNFVDIFA